MKHLKQVTEKRKKAVQKLGKEKLLIILLSTALVVSLICNGILGVQLSSYSLGVNGTEDAADKDQLYTGGPETTEPSPEQLIPSQYITLFFPKDVVGRLDVVVSEDEDSTVMTFSGIFDGKEVKLFEICLTKTQAEGYVLGEFNHSDHGKLSVVMHMAEIPAEEWSEEVYSEISVMQERVNDIIAQFYDDDRFVPNH